MRDIDSNSCALDSSRSEVSDAQGFVPISCKPFPLECKFRSVFSEITTASGAVVTGAPVNLYGGDLVLGANIDAGSSNIMIVEQCSTTDSIGIGGSGSGDTMNIGGTNFRKRVELCQKRK